MSKTNIEWTGHTWNPLSGCTKVSDGCKNCYAEKMANRLQAMGAKGYENGFAVTLHPDKLDEPLRRKKPTMYFVCSMGDLFHESVPFEFIDRVFQVIALCGGKHTFQILTKRPKRMNEYFESRSNFAVKVASAAADIMENVKVDRIGLYTRDEVGDDIDTYASVMAFTQVVEQKRFNFPLKNVWLGVTAENQEEADRRIPVLIDTPAAVRFVSIEPMLGEINLQKLHHKMVNGAPSYPCNEPYLFDIDWVIVGGETGTNARPMHPDWVRSIQKQCEEAKVPFFFKQWGEYKTLPQGKSVTGYKSHFWEDGRQAVQVGKKQAGHLLDGVEYREMPEVKNEK